MDFELNSRIAVFCILKIGWFYLFYYRKINKGTDYSGLNLIHHSSEEELFCSISACIRAAVSKGEFTIMHMLVLSAKRLTRERIYEATMSFM